MRVSEIIDYVILETGNYLIDTLLRSEVDLPKFMILIKSVLSEYTNYRPNNKNISICISKSPYLFIPETAPLTIHKVNTGFLNVPGIIENDPFRVIERLHIPVMPPWRYENPKLYTFYSGVVEIGATFNYIISPIGLDYELNDISFSNTEFLEMVKGKFLMAVGKQRRAFTVNDLPIATDASEIVSEGKEIFDAAKEQLHNNSKWWVVI